MNLCWISKRCFLLFEDSFCCINVTEIFQINDLEFDIPAIAPPSLESILWDGESEEGSDSASVHSLQSVTSRFRSLLYHCILKGVSSQVASAGV